MEKPFQLFSEWLDAAKADPDITEPTAMTLATATAEGIPSARIVLLKGFSVDGFVFYTNFDSRKGGELKTKSQCVAVFLLDEVRGARCALKGGYRRLVRCRRGCLFRHHDHETGKLVPGPHCNHNRLPTRQELESRVAALELQYANKEVPRPPHWCGWRLVRAQRIEFWHQNWARLHERDLFTREGDMVGSTRYFIHRSHYLKGKLSLTRRLSPGQKSGLKRNRTAQRTAIH